MTEDLHDSHWIHDYLFVDQAFNPLAMFISIATVLLLFGATSVFAELKASLDEIWELPAVREFSLWDLLRTRLLSFGLVLVLAFLMMVSLVLSAALAVLERYWGGIWKDAAPLLSTLAGIIGFSVIATLFAVIYKMLPRVRLSWHDVFIGSLGTAGLFTLGKFSIGLYIGNGSVANSFGAAGSIVALLLWVYYSAQIFFLGAEFTRHYALHFGSLKNTHAIVETNGEAKSLAARVGS